MKETLYIDNPPNTIPCIYCGHSCLKTQPYESIVEYFCYNHGDTVPMFRAARHKIPGPNWFFNVIKVTRGNYRFDWNFYSGNWAWLEEFIPAQDRKWGSHWKPVTTKIPAIFLYSSIPVLSNFLKLCEWRERV